ncbi:MAG: 2-phosphosulfolactate phosphatase [Nocardioides sp.]|nr:2-phosphosulfolactate phosphatase [Nocardioides sp.]
MTLPGHDQSSYRLRLEWGPTGAEAVPADYAVVVDVLSFTTTLSVALERGIEVFPFRWRDARAAEHAVRHGATLAVGRFEALSRGGARHVSLSPASLAEVVGVERLVLPSPNGSTIAFALADGGAQVVGACLRNATAVARWLAPRVAGGASVVVVPAGERWHDDTLRPAVEDLWGAGAVLAELGGDGLSPEAATAVAAFRAADLPDDLARCASGRELVDAGFADDVAIAAQHEVSELVPVLVGESFRSADDLEPPARQLRRVGP